MAAIDEHAQREQRRPADPVLTVDQHATTRGQMTRRERDTRTKHVGCHRAVIGSRKMEQLEPVASQRARLVARFGAQIDDAADPMFACEGLGSVGRERATDRQIGSEPIEIDHCPPYAHARGVLGASLAARAMVSPDASDARSKVGQHAAWAMAVGGMIGGGIYTLAGVIVGIAGPWAWLSILLGALIALATVHSYAQLSLATRSSGIPLTIILRDGRRSLAGGLAWALLGVYVLSLAVYTYTVGHYFGNAFGAGSTVIVAIEAAVISVLVVLNLMHVQHPAHVQIAAVWAELAILATLAAIGFWRWNPANLGVGVPSGSIAGVLLATATTFIAFEGFEMLTYDIRELRHPRPIMRKWLPAAVIAVATAYILVTLGAASLVGARTLVVEQDAALAVAGRAAAGTTGMVVVTIAACASATSAINATLFSASRLARSAGEHGLLPRWYARPNRYDAPAWSIVVIATGALTVAALLRLAQLVTLASLAFLGLFGLVNVMAFRRGCGRRWIAALGALGSAGGVVAILISYAS